MERQRHSSEEAQSVGFIGLGQLGLPLANNLLDAGYRLRVYNRTPSKADPLVARGAQAVATPLDAVTAGGVVVNVLWDDAALEGMVASAGFLDALGPGGVHVSMSTVRPETAKRLALMHEEHGSFLVEAPVFGRPEAALARQLWIPVCGASGAKARVRPLLDALGAQGVFDFGEAAGAATMVKLVGNFLIGSAARSMAEALAVAAASGVESRAIVDMLTTTLFCAPVYQSYGKRLVEGVQPLRGGIPQKDIGLLMATAESVGMPTPLAAALYDIVRA